MTLITNSNYVYGKTYEQNTELQGVKTHRHSTKGEFEYTGDTYVCTNKQDVKEWLRCAKANGNCEGLSYIPEKTTTFLLFFSDTEPAKYTYKAQRGDTPQSVRAMFNLKPGALRKHDEYIFDINEPYPAGKIITFDEDDIMH